MFSDFGEYSGGFADQHWSVDDCLDTMAQEFDRLASQLDDDTKPERLAQQMRGRARNWRRLELTMWSLVVLGAAGMVWARLAILPLVLTLCVAILCHLRTKEYRLLADYYGNLARRWYARKARRQLREESEEAEG